MLRVKKSGEPSHSLGDLRSHNEKGAQPGERHSTEPQRISARNKHYDKRRCSDQSSRAQIDFAQHEHSRKADDREWKNQSKEHIALRFFVARKPGPEKKDRGQLSKSGRLKSRRPQTDPAARSIEAHTDVRNIAKRQRGQREHEPNPPCPPPEMIV